MAQEFDPKLVDRRIVERYIRRGELTEKDLEKALKTLPDMAAEAVPVESKLEDTKP
jgi:hypothetical protein